eukprot:CAMPEP_0174749552 /NCGR_PEP_ID=MMETSP1094-20130205/95909_1 /TAXON_ID=156173 /ORGANISM="Chrysochromulina brevifilum, Strain UTEX LB 985" /LENGTH=57 /DNA_ID=CAMNT_0015954769 /DNA_START=1 /DNA_END=171 /DNA_ORIENTATION=-
MPSSASLSGKPDDDDLSTPMYLFFEGTKLATMSQTKAMLKEAVPDILHKMQEKLAMY